MGFLSKNNIKYMNYPYTPTTKVPKVLTESANGVVFTHMLWPSNLKDDQGAIITKARLLIVHGFGEHTQIYYRFMDSLSQLGIETFIFDQRGAGKTSPGKLKGRTNEYHTFNDLDYFIERNLKECDDRGLKLFLFGHSMGGGIVLNYGCTGKYKDRLAGILSTGPLIMLHPSSAPNKVLQFISPVLAGLLPTMKVDTRLDHHGITSHEDYRSFLQSDPMSTPLYGTFKQIYDFLQRGKRLYQDKEYVQQFDRPVFILHGQDDTINDPVASKKFIELCPYEDKQLKIYHEARHSLCLEKEDVFVDVVKDILDWVTARI